MKIGTPSEALLRHVEQVLGNAVPGSCLPTDTELAKPFKLSSRTVGRVMSALAREGKVIRIRGKGTFVPGANQDAALVIPQALSPNKALTERIFELISRGEIRHGEALPTVKYMSRRFKIAPAQVVAAYRVLIEKKVVSRIGKTFWVGGFRYLLQPERGRDVVFLFKDEAALEGLFQAASFGGRLYHAAADTLSDAGCLVQFRFFEEINRLHEAWGSSGKLPMGLFLCGIDEFVLQNVPVVLRDIIQKKHLSTIRVALDWNSGKVPGVTRAECVFSHSHTATIQSRALARFSTAGGFQTMTFFVDTDAEHYGLGTLFDYLRSFSEAAFFDSSLPVSLSVTGKPEKLLGSVRVDVANRLAGKQTPCTWDQIKRDFLTTHPRHHAAFDDVWRRDSSRAKRATGPLWVFPSDAHAVRALEWADQNRVSIPEQLNIITLEDNALFFRHGLTSCRPDWENAGYLIAHAILGDIPIPKSRKGYLDYPAKIREKLTTVHLCA